MEWLTALKGLFSGKVKLKDVLHIEAHQQIESIKNSNNKATSNSTTFINNGNMTVLQLAVGSDNKLPKETLEQLREVLLPEFENGDLLFLKNESRELVKSFQGFKQEPETAELLSFFKDKITSQDFLIFETGLYEAYMVGSRQTQDSIRVKSDIITRYGTRGKNILNLASGGYFKSHIKPLYEAMAAETDFKIENFREEFDRIIEEMPFAIFVHNGMSEEEILQKVDSKARNNIQYGVDEDVIYLNGLGGNADRLEALLPALKLRYRRIAPATRFIGDLKAVQINVYYREIIKLDEINTPNLSIK